MDESADGVRIGQVGAKGINTKANGRGENIVTKEGDIVHKDCRKRYSNGKYVVRVEKGSSSANISPPAATRSSTPSFTFEDNCLYCSLKVREWEWKKKKLRYAENKQVKIILISI